MSSSTASGQRKALKKLAKIQYDVFVDEDAGTVVEKVVYKDVEKATKEAVNANDERGLSEDVSMNNNEDFQCGYCGEYHEDWILCENKACTVGWYGLECIGLVEVPAGRWICALCRPRPIFPNLLGAPKVVKQDDAQQVPKGVATKKRSIVTPKPRWKGWVEVSDEAMEKMQQEADAQWEVMALPKRTRTIPKLHERKQKRRLRRHQQRINQSPQPAKSQKSQQRSIPEPLEEDSRSMDDDQLAQEPAAALANQGRLNLSEPLVHPEDDGAIEEEAESSDEGISARYDRESTFEGFSDPEKPDNIGSGLGESGVVDEVEEAANLTPGDQSAYEISDADEDQDFEMADNIESGLDGPSVADEDDEAGILLFGDRLPDVVSNVDDGQGAEPRSFATEVITEVDIGGGAPMETLGVGAMDYTYLDLSRYGPYLVRRS